MWLLKIVSKDQYFVIITFIKNTHATMYTKITWSLIFLKNSVKLKQAPGIFLSLS